MLRNSSPNRAQLLFSGMIAPLFIAVGGMALSQNVAQKPASPEALAFFETKVRPLLAEKCFSCHSERTGQAQGGLKLDSKKALLAGGAHGSALSLETPEKSLLLRALSYEDKNLQMPPSGKLRDAEIAAITAWVKSGAAWAEPSAVKPAPVVAKAQPRKPFWAYAPPKTPSLPSVKNIGWAKNPLDRFLLAGLEAKGLKPAPPADRRTLIRRATFDLTGLPPTPKEVEDFLKDTKPGAFGRVVDRLLASPAYGERWGRHWLDVARYADSNGLDENLVFTQAWRYRDYVIRAFNQDKPISRFIQEQIAGDLLPPLAQDEDDLDRTIATGYLAIGPKMLAEDDPMKQELDIIDEQVDTLGKTFWGMTLGCARCHDHKFDPISQQDYYALAGIFKSAKTMLKFQVVAEWQELPLASKADRDKLAAFEKSLKEKRDSRKSLIEKETQILLSEAQRQKETYRMTAKEALFVEASGAVLEAVLGKPNARASADAKQIEAEDFQQGNVLKDRDGYGKGIGVLVNAGPLPNITEYDIEVPVAAPYQLDLRYASGDSRPIRIYLNGTLVASNAAGQVTGGFYPDTQKWFAEGVFAFKAGKNRLKFERDSYFPHIDKMLLTPILGRPIPRTLESLAAEKSLIPEFLAQAKEAIRKAPAGDIVFVAPEKPEDRLPMAIREEIKRQDAEIASLEKAKPMLPKAMAVSEGVPANLHLMRRGNYLNLGEECPRRFPLILASAPQKPITQGSGRLELAQWMTCPDHPLTARVFVNRVWRWHFGKGIVRSTDNFGALGDRPLNQALLDWLAVSFVSDGWSLKKLHRRIMLTNTYQMSGRYDPKAAQKDPENLLHWRNDRRRLEAEAVRDAILAVSGELDRTMGGTLLNFKDREYVTSTANADPVNYNSPRRSVYLPVVRSALYDVYTAFDFGDPTVMNGDRSSTTIAPQALFMMNSPLVLSQTRKMAEKLLARAEFGDTERIQEAYALCYGRPATSAEAVRAAGFVQKLENAYKEKPNARLLAWQSLCKTLVSANEFIFVE